MSTIMNAMNAYLPQVIRGLTVKRDELVEFIASSTGLNERGILQVLAKLRGAVLYHNCRRRAVNLAGLGMNSPSIKLDRTLKINH